MSADSSSASNARYTVRAPRRHVFLTDVTNAIMELFKTFKIDSVSRLQPTPPRCISPDKPIAEAVAMMPTTRVGCLLILENRELLGIVTERDVMRRVIWRTTAFHTGEPMHDTKPGDRRPQGDD